MVMDRTRTLLSNQASAARASRDPLSYLRLTDPQRAWLSVTARLALWRGANQIGKSHGQAADILLAARDTHPYRQVRRRKGPVKLLVVSESWAQMDPLCEKLWELLPKDEIDPKVKYVPGQGIQGFKERVIPFTSGPGKGSVIYLATYQQGAGRIAGSSVHGAYLDEPPPESVYGEIMPRLSKHHGWLRVSMTPTPESPPLGYLKEKVDAYQQGERAGNLFELHTPLSLEALTLRGGLVEAPWKTREELDEIIGSYLEVERGMRVNGDWDPVAVGRWLTNWTDELLDTRLMPSGRVHVGVGIDHGAKAGRQYAALLVCDAAGERVGVLDEVLSDGRTSPQEDAQNVLLMLERNGFRWQDVDYWLGDRAHGGDYWGNEKSNRDLMHAFSKILKLPKYQLQGAGLRLHVPYKRRGSVTRGLRLMNGLARHKQLVVHPRCVGFVEAAKNWDGRMDSPLKDRLDGVRYVIEKFYDRNVLRPAKSPTGHIF
jgi:phage terminase large subunit-like protein